MGWRWFVPSHQAQWQENLASSLYRAVYEKTFQNEPWILSSLNTRSSKSASG
ncbi:Uncharacterised protein [Yersinia enterocolitica]|nr:Uncharacterised protein [Yersinia enterocolitica]CNC67682.1 Uncharacterised protein [Yersinia enterocolitica]CNC77347.1 Uncharacterised protein [Yersinia enterocolitica]CNF66396.1 Uncharacterised protein [Yersinia enterocolitica]CNK14648.1 Uncharacterised protein [Yersinia enterocolitica]